MAHWSDAYVGRAYIPEVGDCAALAEQVAHEVLGLTIGLPASHASGYRSQAKQILELKDSYAVKIDEPQDGQPILLIARGRVCHIGVMCFISSQWWVLHADQSAGMVIRQKLSDVTRLHFMVEGYYKWI